MQLSNWILIYSLAILLIPLAGYVLFIIRDGNIAWELSRTRLGRCTSCQRVFLVKRHTLAPRCPRCNAVTVTYLSKN